MRRRAGRSARSQSGRYGDTQAVTHDTATAGERDERAGTSCTCCSAAVAGGPGDVLSRPPDWHNTGKRTVQSQRKRDAGLQFL